MHIDYKLADVFDGLHVTTEGWQLLQIIAERVVKKYYWMRDADVQEDITAWILEDGAEFLRRVYNNAAADSTQAPRSIFNACYGRARNEASNFLYRQKSDKLELGDDAVTDAVNALADNETLNALDALLLLEQTQLDDESVETLESMGLGRGRTWEKV